jgi:hypothetical protein
MDKYESDNKAEEMFRFQVRRNIVSLFKRFLENVEALGDCHQESMDKLKELLPEEYKKYVNLAEYFTPAREEALRKQILDAGNDCIRNIEEELKQFKIKFRQDN